MSISRPFCRLNNVVGRHSLGNVSLPTRFTHLAPYINDYWLYMMGDVSIV